ncbi:MAG: LamG domain-containing protein receptor [candidate division WWE3 bacterium GW2011_GWC2_44_9]|uniref:LamG domain-containing protein receptor n=1 Tax=candidate division WWE3 bacterium GW2011_GWC2_44_9 TaxID=1619125 RepID=A0A0G1KJV8_UNCKA|nr:MAG: LamG domain-containing protein receptor [candidate division WWE3 bacterium GW2011_GWC2_44_9]
MVTKKVLNLFKPLSKALVRFSAVKKTAAPFAFGALLVIVPVALLVMKNAQPVSAAWYDSGWHFRKKIVINRTQVAGTFDLVNFPFLLTKIDLDVRTYSQEDGGDIMFADSGGTKLDHELQMFDFASGKIVAWVKIPVLSVTKDTELYMYYGNVNSADQENPAGVWADGFTGVWHLEDSPLDTPQVMDSTGSDIHGIYSQSMSASNQVDGVIGDAVDFAGAEDYVNFASSSGQVQTLEFWTKPADLTSFFINLSDEPKYVWADTGQVQLAGEPAAQVYVNGGAGGAIKAGVWNHVAVTASAQTLTKLQFGLVRSTDYYSGDYYSGDYYSGVLDEIRISNVVRSPDWLKTSYINQQDPSAFMTFSAQDRGPNSPASPTLFWRFNEAGGTTANDASSYANTGTLAASTATPTWNTTSFVGGGASLYFDGSNDYVSKSYSSDTELNPGTASMSVDLWFNHPSAIAGTDTLISRASGTLASEVGYKIYMTSSGYMCFGIDDTAGSFPEDNACSTTSYADSSWHHLEVTKDGITSITLYIDGLQVATNTNTGSDATISGTNPAFYVGVDSDGASNPWTGFIDEVRVYDVLRSASDVKTDYAARGATRGVGVSFGGSQINEKLSKGLVGYWKMDEGVADSCSGTEDNCDSSGTGAHGVWNNNSTFAGGKYGNAVSNDGTGDYVSVADNTAHEPSSITISSWIYWTGIGDNWLISKQSAFDSYTNGYLMRADTPTNTVWCKFGNGSTVDTPTVAVATGAWYHMVCTYDNGVARIYQNGSLIGTTTGTATGLTYTSVGDLTFGGHSGSTGLTINGKMDEVRIYNRALAASEITSLYNWEPGPVGYWKFDENSGSTALDVSGNGKDLSLTSVTYNTGKYGSSTAFNGSTSTSSVTDGPSLSLTNTGTLEAWVYSNRAYPSDDGTTKYRNIINKWTAGACSGADEGYLFDWYGTSSAATLRGWVCNGTTAQGITYSTTLTANAWTHVAYVWDGSYHRLYMNGVQVGTPASQTINNQDDTGTLRVGDGFGGGSIYRWDGRLDEARVYNYARTSDQIVEDMNAGHPTGGSPVASQVGYWKFDDGYGSTAQDSSPNNLDLTLYYSPTWTNSGKFNKALDMEKNSFNYASAADSTALSITGSLTLSSWLNPESVTASTEFPIAGKWSSSGKSYLLAQYGDEIRMYIDSASNYVTTDAANLAAGTWYYVAGVYNSTAQTVTIYINGVAYTATTTGTIPSSIGDDTDAFVVGTDQLPTTMSTISVSASLDDGYGNIGIHWRQRRFR